jgi:5'-3' exonuclease
MELRREQRSLGYGNNKEIYGILQMNQQRIRRFRSAKEAAEKRERIANIRKKLESKGVPLPPPPKEVEHFDSNCITPGTSFMGRLATALRYYIHKQITHDPTWMKIQVFSLRFLKEFII